MKKYNTLITFFTILSIWSFLFSAIKYFIWNDFSFLNIDLQVLSGYLSLGAIFAYLVGWALAYSFLKRYLLFFLAFWVSALLILLYFLNIKSALILWIIFIIIWFLYSLWVILRNIILSIEIEKTWIKDTKLNAIANVLFIVFIILWTILGSKIYEIFSKNGIFVLFVITLILAFVSLALNYDKVCIWNWIKLICSKKYLVEKHLKLKESFSKFLPEIKFIYKNLFYIIIVSSILWTITTIISQKAIELAVANFHIQASKAGFILLYSSLGAILWNIISSFLKSRWKSFFILNFLMSFAILAFIVFQKSFFQISVLAFILWTIFGASSNLIDAYFLKRIWDENKKEYGSATYGLVFSIVLAIGMFFASFIDKKIGTNTLFVIMAIIVLFSNFYFYKKVKW